MKLTLDIVSDDPSLNSFSTSKVVSFIKGETLTVNIRLWREDLGIRYIPSEEAVITIDLLKSDGEEINKTLTAVFEDDRSIQSFSLSAEETESIISQNLLVKIVDGEAVNFALLQKGLQKTKVDGSC